MVCCALIHFSSIIQWVGSDSAAAWGFGATKNWFCWAFFECEITHFLWIFLFLKKNTRFLGFFSTPATRPAKIQIKVNLTPSHISVQRISDSLGEGGGTKLSEIVLYRLRINAWNLLLTQTLVNFPRIFFFFLAGNFPKSKIKRGKVGFSY